MDQGLLIHFEHRGERPWHLDCFLSTLGLPAPPPDPRLPETKDGGIPRG